MTLKLSIIIPCYNMGDFVKVALNSVISYPKQEDIEIIIINDGSDDNDYTKSVLDNITHENVQVIHQENKGLGKARNNGIKLAKAPYVIPLDSDNKLRHGLIDHGIAILDSKPQVGLVYSNLKCFSLQDTEVKVGAFDASRIIVKNYIDACVVLRKSAWKSVDGYDEFMPVMGYEDWDLNLRLFFKGWEFYYVDKVLFEYRVRENSMLATSNQNKELLINYMYSKPELLQAKYLREKVLDAIAYKEELSNLKKRKVINLALKLEKTIKSIYKSIIR